MENVAETVPHRLLSLVKLVIGQTLVPKPKSRKSSEDAQAMVRDANYYLPPAGDHAQHSAWATTATAVTAFMDWKGGMSCRLKSASSSVVKRLLATSLMTCYTLHAAIYSHRRSALLIR